MIKSNPFDELARRVSESLPPGLRGLHEEVERNVRAGLHSAIGRLDLVSREEFDIQQAVLLRTRERLEALERQVAALEAKLQEQQTR